MIRKSLGAIITTPIIVGMINWIYFDVIPESVFSYLNCLFGREGAWCE